MPPRSSFSHSAHERSRGAEPALVQVSLALHLPHWPAYAAQTRICEWNSMGLRAFSESLLKGKSLRLHVQVFRYLIVSVICLGVDAAVLWILTEYAQIHYLWSGAISYLVGLVVNYLLSRIWVFHSSKLKSKTAEFSIFVGIGAVGMGINEGVLWLFVESLGLHYMYGRAVSAVVGYTWKYVARKILLFR